MVDIGQYIQYLPMTDRPTIEWPNGARLALWLAPNLEFYEFQPPPNRHRRAWGRTGTPDVMAYAYRDYGNRVGFWRMLKAFDHFQVPASAAMNLALLDHFPEIRSAVVERDWEIFSHGIYNTRYLFGASEDEEREFYRDSIETLQKHTGKRLRGMLGPSYSATENTPRLMAEAGLTYHTDWFIDDQPFPISLDVGKLIGIPYSREVNDALLINGWPYYSFEADYFAEVCKGQFDVLYGESAEGGRVMCIGLHPFYIGRPGRIRYLYEALEYILSHDDVWVTTAEQIADHYIEHYYDEAVEMLRGSISPG